MELLSSLFNTSDFTPRWDCGLWTSLHGYSHIAGDLFIWGAYFAIPAVLAYFIWRRRDLPLPGIFWLFAAFIFACGTTHLLDATMFYWPAYRLLAVAKVATAAVSWATVMALIPATPKALALPGLAKINSDLQHEIQMREQTELELAAAARRLEVKNQDISEFVSIITHDLKHPVFSIRTLQSLIKQRSYQSLSEQDRQYLDLTLSECDRMMEMLNELSALSRIERADVIYEAHDLQEFLHRCVARFRGPLEEAGCRIEVRAPQRRLVLPRQQIEESLNNLIDNAIRHGTRPRKDGKNPCGLDSTGACVPCIRLVAEVIESEVSIRVEDDGPGIDPRHHQRVFQLFHRVNTDDEHGSGIGLAAVRRLMQRVNGTVSLESQPDHGARFTLRFPLQEPSS